MNSADFDSSKLSIIVKQRTICFLFNFMDDFSRSSAVRLRAAMFIYSANDFAITRYGGASFRFTTFNNRRRMRQDEPAALFLPPNRYPFQLLLLLSLLTRSNNHQCALFYLYVCTLRIAAVWCMNVPYLFSLAQLEQPILLHLIRQLCFLKRLWALAINKLWSISANFLVYTRFSVSLLFNQFKKIEFKH